MIDMVTTYYFVKVYMRNGWEWNSLLYKDVSDADLLYDRIQHKLDNDKAAWVLWGWIPHRFTAKNVTCMNVCQYKEYY